MAPKPCLRSSTCAQPSSLPALHTQATAEIEIEIAKVSLSGAPDEHLEGGAGCNVENIFNFFETPLDDMLTELESNTSPCRAFIGIEDGAMKCYMAMDTASAEQLQERGLVEMPLELVSSRGSAAGAIGVRVPKRIPSTLSSTTGETAAEMLVRWFENEVESYSPLRCWTPAARAAVWSKNKGSKYEPGKFSGLCKAYVYVCSLDVPPAEVAFSCATLIAAPGLEASEPPKWWERAVKQYERRVAGVFK